MKAKYVVAGLAIAFFGSLEAFGATLNATTTKEGKVVIFLAGDIAEGDAATLRGLIKSANDADRIVSGVRLNSPGGSLAEGFLLADVIRNARTATVVANGSTCASACFLAFAGGADKFASFAANIGVHGASDSAGRETVVASAATVSMARFAKDLGVPSGIIGKMVVTPPNQMVWLSPNDLRAMGTTMTGKPSQTAMPTPLAPQQQTKLSPPPSKPPEWGALLSQFISTSEAQNGGKARIVRGCQPELKLCNTGVWIKGKDGNEMLAKATEDLSGKVFQRELCTFNAFNDVRTCVDWDTGKSHRDMKDPEGRWSAVETD